MQLTATTKPFLYRVNVSVPDILDLELDKLAYTPLSFQPDGFSHRSTLRDFTHCNAALTKVIDHVRSSQYQLLDQLWLNPRYSEHIWAGTCSLEQLKTTLSPYIELSRDQPGYYCHRHVDNLRAVTTGMIFFNHCDLPRSSTRFYSKQWSLWGLRMPSGPGQGWYTANWHDCWHSGSNSTDQVRYSLKFGLHFTL
jgi:hypothetical protein